MHELNQNLEIIYLKGRNLFKVGQWKLYNNFRSN